MSVFMRRCITKVIISGHDLGNDKNKRPPSNKRPRRITPPPPPSPKFEISASGAYSKINGNLTLDLGLYSAVTREKQN